MMFAGHRGTANYLGLVCFLTLAVYLVERI